jgi:fructose-specific phosphotransferase system component IIB
MAFQDPKAAAEAAFGGPVTPGTIVTVGDKNYTVGADGSYNEGAPAGFSDASSETKSNTPPKWDVVQDARKLPDAGKYPNYWAHKTRSGHVFMMDDSKGAESVTIQHRGGSMIQINPDGKVHIRAQNGQHTVVFGENRMYVTGAHDITVDGSASMNIKKDFNVNAKNINFTASGDMNLKSKNLNLQPTGNIDIAGSALTLKSNANINIETHGALGIAAKKAVSLVSKEAEVVFVSSKDIGMESKNGRVLLQSKQDMSVKSIGKFSVRSDQKLSISSPQIIAIDSDVTVAIQKRLFEPPEEQKTVSITPSETTAV